MLDEFSSGVNIIPFSQMSFSTEKIIEEYGVCYHAYFRDKEGHLLGLFKFHISETPPFVAIINDSTSSSSYSFFPDDIKEMYNKNNFREDILSEKGSAHLMLSEVLQYIYNNFSNISWVNFAEDAGQKNKQRLGKLINETKEKSAIILDIRGGREYAWTIQIRK